MRSRRSFFVALSQRILSLKNALPYFDKVIELQEAVGYDEPNIWFLKARTEYNLAKFRVKRKYYAKQAIKSYRKYLSIEGRPSKNKRKTLKRNMKRLRSWRH